MLVNSYSGNCLMTEAAQFIAKLEMLPSMLGWVRVRLCETAISTADRNKFEVASEEILVNVIKYAYKEKQQGSLEMIWKVLPSLVSLTVVDFGRPFNPLKDNKQLKKSSSIEMQEEGGLGILLVKRLVDKVEYVFANGANQCTISQKI